MTMTVSLTMSEWHHSIQTGVLRMMVSEMSRFDRSRTMETSWHDRLRNEVTGAAGEVAVAKALRRFHIGSINTFHGEPDCLGGVEVRATERDDGCLIVRDRDPDDRYYVLAIYIDGAEPSFRLAGWIKGADAKRDEWTRNPSGRMPAWFVPQHRLKAFRPRA